MNKRMAAKLARAGAPPPIAMNLHGSVARELAEAEALVVPMRTFLIKHSDAFDGMIASDYTGALAIRLLHELGLRIPEDIAVVGGGDSVLATYGEVPMTSVNAENDVAGAQAFGLLMDRIGGRGNGAFRRLINPAMLIARKSTLAD